MKSELPKDPLLPWERQLGETAVQFKLFCIFRDLDPLERSISRVVSEAKGKVNANLVHKTRDRWDWFERAAAWDEEQDAVRRRETTKQMVREAHRVVDDTSGYQFLFAGPVREFMRRWTSNDVTERMQIENEMKSLTVAQLIQLATITARPFLQMWEAQREALGITAQHLIVQQKFSDKPSDPFQTDESYFAKVVLAWQEANLLPPLNENQQKLLEVKARTPQKRSQANRDEPPEVAS